MTDITKLNDRTLLAFCMEGMDVFDDMPKLHAFCEHLREFTVGFVPVRMRRPCSAKVQAQFRANLESHGQDHVKWLMDDEIVEPRMTLAIHNDMMGAALNHTIVRLGNHHRPAIRPLNPGGPLDLTSRDIKIIVDQNGELFDRFMRGVGCVSRDPQHIMRLG